jgi:nitronate monooxygenase
MHLCKDDEDVVVITSCVKGMKARAVRNAFTDALAAGERFPPRSKAWFFGTARYRDRRKACIECLAQGLCKCQASDFRESFCIQDALLRAVKLGDTRTGLFYTGQSVTRIPERRVAELKSVQELVSDIEDGLARGVMGPTPTRCTGVRSGASLRRIAGIRPPLPSGQLM